MGIRKRQFTRRQLLDQTDFLQNFNSLFGLGLANRGANVTGNLLDIDHATVQFQVGAHSRNPPVAEELELGGFQVVAVDVTQGERLGHKFLTLAFVLADGSGVEQIEVFSRTPRQIQNILGRRQRMRRQVLLLLKHAIQVAGIQPQLIAHHPVRVERHFFLPLVVVGFQEVAVVRYVRKSNHRL